MRPNLVTTSTDDNLRLQLRELWLDKLWRELFNGEQGGLMSPGQIRREHRNRIQVRQLEMAAIIEAEEEINLIHSGLKSIDDHGNVIDTPPVEHVVTYSIIENATLDTELDSSLTDSSTLLRSAVREISVRDLERSLNLRRLTILAESEILSVEPAQISRQPVNPQWLVRWRENAQDVFGEELQLLWARMLVAEVASPGSFSLDAIGLLSQLGSNDVELIRFAAKYPLGDFIYDARADYFNTAFHISLFDELGDLGLLNTRGEASRVFASQSQTGYEHIFVCRDKALRVSADVNDQTLQLPIIKLSRIGRQIFTLLDAHADLAYLNRLGAAIKQQNFRVSAGDWLSVEGKPQFAERLAL